MALVDRAVSKAPFWQLLADRFRAAFLRLGLPVIVIVLLSVLAALLHGLS